MEKAKRDGFSQSDSTVEAKLIELIVKTEMNQQDCIQCSGCAAAAEDMMSLASPHAVPLSRCPAVPPSLVIPGL